MSDYLLNSWYVAAWSDELADKPLARRYFDQPVVLYRTEAGDVAAIANSCPHRFAHLDGGRVIGEALECPYHGLRFGPSGACTHSPFSPEPPANARVRSYPVREDDGFIWFWPGDPALAADTPLPDYRFMRQSPSYVLVRMYNHMKADFLYGIDNLMELSHAGFLHRNTLSQGTDMLANFFRAGKYRGFEENGFIISRWEFSDVDYEWAQSRYQAPSTVLVSKGFDHSIPPKPVMQYGLHLFTPESRNSTHYFAIEPYDSEVFPDPGHAAMLAEFIGKTTFHDEDCVLIEGIQDQLGDRDLMEMRPVLLPIDAGAVQARRHYKKRVEAEQR